MTFLCFYKDMTFKNKLLLHVAFSAGIALFMILFILLRSTYYRHRDSAVHNLSTNADLISINSTAPLSFHDMDAGEETLSALKAIPEIVEASIHTVENEKFASYLKKGAVHKETPEMIENRQAMNLP